MYNKNKNLAKNKTVKEQPKIIKMRYFVLFL